jgi:hypothetical protein
MFHIETILNHRGNKEALSSLQFQVKWLGYDNTHNSWEPWKNLRGTKQLHDYLIQNKLHGLIPKEFRHSYPEIFQVPPRQAPLEPLQGFAATSGTPRKGPRQVRNSQRLRQKKVLLNEDANTYAEALDDSA